MQPPQVPLPPGQAGQLPTPAPSPPTLQDYSAYDRFAMQQPRSGRSKKGSFFKAALLSVGAIVIAGGFAAGAYVAYTAFSASPQDRFNTAIEKRLDTTLIQQDYDISVTYQFIDMKVRVTSVSDFSDPANPKSKGRYTVDLGNIDGQSSSSAEAEFVIPNKSDTYVRFISVPASDASIPKNALNQWVKLDTDYSRFILDPFSVASELNTPLGEIITGRFGGELRDSMLARIRNDFIYGVTNSSDEDLAGIPVTKYSVNLNKGRLTGLNNYVAEQLDLSAPSAENPYPSSSFVAWVNRETDYIVRLQLKDDENASIISYRNPSMQPDFNAPADYVNGSTLFDR